MGGCAWLNEQEKRGEIGGELNIWKSSIHACMCWPCSNGGLVDYHSEWSCQSSAFLPDVQAASSWFNHWFVLLLYSQCSLHFTSLVSQVLVCVAKWKRWRSEESLTHTLHNISQHLRVTVSHQAPLVTPLETGLCWACIGFVVEDL